MKFRDVRGEYREKPEDKKVYPRTAVFGIAIRKGEVFCVKEAWCGGLYGFPGGAVDEGESIKEALRREFLEETGRDIEIGPEPVHSIRWNYYSEDKKKYFDSVHIFFRVEVGEKEKGVEADDIDGTLWLGTSNISSENTRYAHWEALKGLL